MKMCAWPGCEYGQDDRLHVCYAHWIKLPHDIRSAIVNTYRQDWASQPIAYRQAVQAAIAWIDQNIQGKVRTYAEEPTKVNALAAITRTTPHTARRLSRTR